MTSTPKQKQNTKNYFQIEKSQQKQTNKNPSKTTYLENATINIVSRKKYLYIDLLQPQINENLYQMQRIKNNTIKNQDYEKISKKDYICGIQNLSPNSQRGLDYFDKDKQFKKQKNNLRKLFKQKMDENRNKSQIFSSNKNNVVKSRDGTNINKIKKQIKSSPYISISQSVYAEQEQEYQKNKKIKNNKNKQTMKTIDYSQRIAPSYIEKSKQKSSKIIEKQRVMIRKYGFTNLFQSITRRRSPIVRDNDSRKIYLPQIDHKN